MDIGLNGCWRARPDPAGIGVTENWASLPWPEEAVIYLPVPGLWQTSQPDLRGAVWYERMINPPAPAAHLEIRVGASNYLTDAWLNGVYLGRHEGGYTPFTFSLDGIARPGEDNRLIFRVADVTDESEFEGLLARQIPGGKERWYYQASGIWQSVTLRATGPAWFCTVRLLPELDRSELLWRVSLGSRDQWDDTLQIEVLDAAGSVLAESRREITLRAGVLQIEGGLALTGVQPWSPADPRLCLVRLRLLRSGDCREERIGFRRFNLLDGRFYLNGREMQLKSVILQPNYPATILYPPDREWARRELTLAKEAGFNAIRFHLLPPVPYVLDLADEIGLLVYEESPVGWIKNGPRLAEHCRREIEEMIRRDWNHPSVVIWGLLNENVPVWEILGRELLSLAAGLDPTRIAIDNSGGTGAVDQFFAWAGRCHYFLPDRGIVPAIDLHIYLNQLENVAFDWLSHLGDPGLIKTLALVGYGRPDDLDRIGGSLSAWAGGIFVSEYGTGGCEDLEASVAGFPPDAIGPDRAVAAAYAQSLHECLRLPGIADAVHGVADFIASAEAVHGRNDFDQTMAMRINPRISGYSLTQLNDCSWEFAAGIADRWRRTKPCLDMIKAANDPLQILLWPGRYAFAAGETLRLRAWLVAEEEVTGRFLLELDGRIVLEKDIKAHGVLDLADWTSGLEHTGWHTAVATFTPAGGDVRSDQRRLLILPAADLSHLTRLSGGESTGDRSEHVFFWPATDMQPDIDWPAVLHQVRQGKTLILADLDPDAVEMLAAAGLSALHPDLQSATSWMPAWHVIPTHAAFTGLPIGVAGPLFAPVLPRYSMAGRPGKTLAWALRGNIHCGKYVGTTNFEFEKWSDLALIPLGKGRIVICQYRLGLEDPIARTILANLAAWAVNSLC